MMTLQNTEGYTQEQLDALNAEFASRCESGYYDWIGTDDEAMDQAEKEFSDEVARRRAGAILGSVKSPKKTAAARINAKKGGYPKGRPRNTGLTALQHQAYDLRQQGLKIKEIAARMGRQPENVRQLLARAQNKIERG